MGDPSEFASWPCPPPCAHWRVRASVKITRVCGERDRALVFRGWSRLCLHAASLSATEGASAAATAVARAARAEAMEKEAAAALEKAKVWGREARARRSILEAELSQNDVEMERVVWQQKLRRMKMLVRKGPRICNAQCENRRGTGILCSSSTTVALKRERVTPTDDAKKLPNLYHYRFHRPARIRACVHP